MAGNFVQSSLLLDDVSIDTESTEVSHAILGREVHKARVVISSSGADVTVTLQSSVDSGNNWVDVESYTEGGTGVQDAVEMPGTLLRLSAANASTGSAQSVTAAILTETV